MVSTLHFILKERAIMCFSDNIGDGFMVYGKNMDYNTSS